jgi:hypothetical protein
LIKAFDCSSLREQPVPIPEGRSVLGAQRSHAGGAYLREQEGRRHVVQRCDLDDFAIIERSPPQKRFARLVKPNSPTQGFALGLYPQEVRILLGGCTTNVGTVTYERKDTRHRHLKDSTTTS